MSGFSVSVQGDKDLIRRLGSLPVRVQRQIARKAIRPAGSMVSKAMKRAVPKVSDEDAAAMLGPDGIGDTTGSDIHRLLKASVARKPKTYTNSSTAIEAVGVRYDFRRDGVDAPAGVLAEMVEFGTDTVNAKPWIRAVVAEVGPQAVDTMLARFRQLVEEEGGRG